MNQLKKYVLIVAIGLVAAAIYLFSWARTSTDLSEQVIVPFSRGTTLTFLAHDLEAKGVISSALTFKIYLKFFGGFEKAQAGTYAFKGRVAPIDVISDIKNGKTHKELIVSYTIPEGFTLEQVLRRLEAKKVGTYKELEALSRDKKFLLELGVNAPNLEGYFYPDTYKYFEKRPSPRDVFKRMVNLFFKSIPEGYLAKIKAKGLTLREAITFASLIEKETMIESEKPMIAEVIWNRINKNMPLGIDAALIYGIHNYDGDIKWKHLKDKSNLYNTRIHKGLPPGPIGTVTTSSLEAILNPTSLGIYYYVLVPGGNGEHKFSKTLKEHNIHVKKLVNSKK